MDIFCREVKPFAPLILNELRFWLRIMKEHAMLICMGLPPDQTELRQKVQQFQCVFENLETRSCEALCGEDFYRFIEIACLAVNKFFTINRQILHCLLECKICGGCLYPLMLDHMSREAFYFLKLLHKFCDSEMSYQVDAITSENVFWLRIMAEHLKIGRDIIDPSERRLTGQVQLLVNQFEQLGQRARDLDSMLWHYEPTNELIRFEREVSEAAGCLYDFQTALECLAGQCAAVSALQPLLADHLRRETEHLLHLQELIRKQLLCCDQGAVGCCRDYD